MAFDFHHSANLITLHPFPPFSYVLSHDDPPSVIQIEKFGVMLDFSFSFTPPSTLTHQVQSDPLSKHFLI